MKRGRAATASSGGSRLSRIVKAPLRVLCRARDLYVSSMTGCAGRINYNGAVGYPGAASVGIPRSYSMQSRGSSSGEDDLRELIRAASQGAMGSLNLGDGLGQSPGSHARWGPTVPRSQSVAIGRIDEDKPCDFGEVAMAGPMYPRSRSYAVPSWKARVGVVP